VRILASRDALLGMREPRAYLSTTARRLLIDQARRRQIEEAYLSELALTAELLEGHQPPKTSSSRSRRWNRSPSCLKACM
jgi:RNA polymerase sigma-70 factor (ECF subfamily)